MPRKVRLAINGFGRIGRAALKIALARPEVEVVALNDLMEPSVLAHLLRYDTVYGRYAQPVSVEGSSIVVAGKKIDIIAEKEPPKLPWSKLNVDVVLECTGRFTTSELAGAHLSAGAKRVIISAPTKSDDVTTIVRGVNDEKLNSTAILSNASCTTNCVAPVTAIMHSNFHIRKAMMTTVHSYTAEQNLVDGPPPALHKDLRRARAAAQNIVPTTTGATTAATKTIPELTGKFGGFAIRVPTAIVSISDFTFIVEKSATVAAVNEAFKKAAAADRWKGILSVTTEPLVSSDFIGNPHSAIIDLALTQVLDSDLVKVVAWYDNEWGYSTRLIDVAVAAGIPGAKSTKRRGVIV